MKSIFILSVLAAASTALARPEQLSSWTNERYRVLRHLPLPENRLSHVATKLAASPSDSLPESTRGGAYITGTNLTFATGTIIVPEPAIPDRGPTGGCFNCPYSASFQVALDGIPGTAACSGTMLRVGVDVFHGDVEGDSYDAWYEWYPEQATSLKSASFRVVPGDRVRMNVTATSATAGVVTMENLSKNMSVSQAVNGQSPLCGATVGWLIEDFKIEGAPAGTFMPLANFTSVTWAEAAARTTSGEEQGPTGATVFELVQSSQGGQLTRCSAASSSVTCDRVVGGS